MNSKIRRTTAQLLVAFFVFFASLTLFAAQALAQVAQSGASPPCMKALKELKEQYPLYRQVVFSAGSAQGRLQGLGEAKNFIDNRLRDLRQSSNSYSIAVSTLNEVAASISNQEAEAGGAMARSETPEMEAYDKLLALVEEAKIEAVQEEATKLPCLEILEEIKTQLTQYRSVGYSAGTAQGRLEGLNEANVDIHNRLRGLVGSSKSDLAQVWSLEDVQKSIKRSIEAAERHFRESEAREKEAGNKLMDLIYEALDTCKCSETGSGSDEQPRNEISAGFTTIREDASPENFNTYGFDVAYTHFLNRSVGVTVDFNTLWRQRFGTDLNKTSLLGGVTVMPFDGAKIDDKVTVSFQALVGVAHLKAENRTTSSTDNALTAKIGGSLSIKINRHFGIRPFELYYNPTWFGGSRQDNVQAGAGVEFIF
jgi:hypothetical protein